MLPYELGRLFQLQTLGLNGNPLQSELVELYSSPNGTYELIGYLLDNHPPNMEAPGICLLKWIWPYICSSNKLTKERNWIVLAEPMRNSFVFSLMCYNVLCDKYCTRQIYGYSPRWSLAWNHRQRLILDEICNFNSDIVCLQVF